MLGRLGQGDSTGAPQASVPSKIGSPIRLAGPGRTARRTAPSCRPGGTVHLVGQVLALEAQQSDQLGVELGLDGPDGHEPLPSDVS
jgi:hypothetical protein